MKIILPIQINHLPDYFQNQEYCKVIASILPITLIRLGIYLNVIFLTRMENVAYSIEFFVFISVISIIELMYCIRIFYDEEMIQLKLSKMSTLFWHIIMITNVFFLSFTLSTDHYSIHPHYFKIRLPLLFNQMYSILTFFIFLRNPAIESSSALLLNGFSQNYLLPLLLCSVSLGSFFDLIIFGSDLNYYIALGNAIVIVVSILLVQIIRGDMAKSMKQLLSSE